MDAIDFKSFIFDGHQNEYNEVIFTLQQKGTHYIISFLIRELPTRKQSPLRITMEPDINHNLPHIHISKGHQVHIAAISLDGQFQNGENKLKRKEKSIILDWIASHTTTLKELWDCAKVGRTDYQEYVEKVNSTWEYEGYKFEGVKPCHQKCIDGIIVWYDGELSSKPTGGLTTVRSTGKMCVLSPYNEENLKKCYAFESSIGTPQILFSH